MEIYKIWEIKKESNSTKFKLCTLVCEMSLLEGAV